MKMVRFSLAAAAAAAFVLAGCTSSPMRPAPVLNLDTSTGAGSVVQPGPASTGSYTIQSGDTLYSIAVRNGCDTVELMKFNGITDPRSIRPGQVIRLTQSRRQMASAAAAAPAAASMPARTTFTPVAQVKASEAVQPSPGLTTETIRIDTKPAEAKADEKADEKAGEKAGEKAEEKSADRAPAAAAEPGQTLAATDFRQPVKGGHLARRFNPPASKGVVIAASEGAPVMAAADGQVVYVGELRGYGKVAIVRHGDSLVTVYGNNKAVSVATRTQVKAGQKIGEVGSSGLLFEVRQAGKPVDPSRFVKVN